MMELAERILTTYDEAEPWKADHDAAVQCLEMEKVVALGNRAYDLLSDFVAFWQDYVARGVLPFNKKDDRRHGDAYRTWVETSMRKLGEIEKLTRDGHEIKGADELRAHLEEARSILESRALEDQMRPIEEILHLAKGNPRPERYGK
jgi:hypothetical protein